LEPVNGDPVRSQAGDEAAEEALSELYLLTAHLVVENGKASTSWLQRQLRIGYNDAAELMEQLEADGLVSPPDAVGRRKVLADIHDLPELPA
jgi:S-DNA-T family DNA segregation ATPase FtsK/SpoIIIE